MTVIVMILVTAAIVKIQDQDLLYVTRSVLMASSILAFWFTAVPYDGGCQHLFIYTACWLG